MKINTLFHSWLTIVLLALCIPAKSQYISGYTFSQSIDTYSPISGGTTLASGYLPEGNAYTVSIPFGFTFDGTTYTSLYAFVNGYVGFGSGGGGASPISYSGTGYKAVSAFGINLEGTATSCAMLSKVEGAAPNRTLVVEWKNIGLWSAGGANLNFQIRLYETTNVAEIVYGSMVTTLVAPVVQVGIRGSSNTQYQNRYGSFDPWTATTAGVGSAATVRMDNVYFPPSGLTFRWTPPPPCAPPATQPTTLLLTPDHTSVSGSYTAAAGASGYLVVRTPGSVAATPPVNGVTYTSGSTLGAGEVVGMYTGTSFTDYGLSYLTNYRYTIFAYRNVGCPGIGYNTVSPLVANVTTTGPRKYTWVPTAGTSNYNTATNWSPSRTFTHEDDTLVFSNGGNVTVTNVPMEILDGLSVSGGTNVKLTSAINDSIRIQRYLDISGGSSLTLAGTSTLKIYFPTGAAKTATINGTLNLGGNSGYNATNSVTTINGTINDTGANATMTTYCNCNGSIIFAAGSTYNHGRNGGGIPRGTYATSSTVNITGITNTEPTFASGTEVGDLIWNCPGQNQTLSTSLLNSVKRDFRIVSTGTDTLEDIYSSLTVGRNFIQTGGVYRISTTLSGKLKVLGDMILNAGTLDMTRYTSGATVNNLLLYGNFTQSTGHSIMKTGTAGTVISFCGNTHQNITANGSMANTRISYQLNNATGATLTGSLPVSAGATNTITRGSWDGTGSFGYDISGDSLIYSSPNATTATGVEWPAINPPANVVLRMTGSGTEDQIALPGNRTVPGIVRCQSGILVLNNFDLQLTSTTGNVGSTADTNGMVAADSTGRLILTIPASTTATGKNWPIGTLKNGKTYTPLTLTFGSNSVARNVGVRCPHRKHPNETSTTDYMNIYWSVTDDGGSAPFVLNNFGVTYLSSEVIGSPEMRLNSWDGATWTAHTGLSGPTSMISANISYLDGRDFTGRPTTHTVYTWTPTINKDYTVAANWTPNRTVRSYSDYLLFNSGSTDSVKNIIANDTVAQVKITNNTSIIWQTGTSVGTVYYNIRNLDPASYGLVVDSGSALLMASNNHSRISFTSPGTTYNRIAGTVELTTNTSISNNVIFANSATTVTSSGRLAAGAMSTYAGFSGDPTCLQIDGVYEHKFTTVGGAIPGASWGVGSTCLISGYTTGSVPGAGSYPIRRLVYNCPSQVTAGSINNLPVITDSFIVVSTGSSSLKLGASASVTYRFNHVLLTGGALDIHQSPINISGTLTQTGGTLYSSSSIGPATLNFNGTTTQSITLKDAAPTGTIFYRISNPAGINLAGTGTLTTSFAINNGGGVRISVPDANPITTSLSLVYDTTNTTLTFDTTAGYGTTAYVADAIIFPSSNGPTNLTVNVGNNSTLQIPFSRTVPKTLNMQAGDILIGANTLTIGKASWSAGTLNWVSGYVVPTTGTLSRWFATSGLPTAAGTSVGFYPLKYGNVLRNAAIYFSSSVALSSAGYIAVSSANTTGFTSGLSVVDGAETMTMRHNSPWTFTSGGGLSLSGSIGAQVTGGGMFSFVSPSRLHMMRASSVTGTHVAGSGTSPNFNASRTGMSLTELTAAPFYIGAQDTMLTVAGAYISVTDGNWNSPSTWNLGSVPPATATVLIANGKTVTINSGACVAAKLTVYPDATLTGTPGGNLTVDTFIINNGTFRLAGNTVTLGPAGGGRRSFTGRGKLAVESGTLNINGQLRMNGGSTFEQTGGDIFVDGNAAGVTSNSLTSSDAIVRFDTCTINSNGGNITIVDPHVSTTGDAVYSNTGTGLGSGFTGTHTFTFGNGISTTSGTTSGFAINCVLPLNNVTVLGSPTGANRSLKLDNTINIRGDLRLTGSTAKFDDNTRTIKLGGNMYADAGATFYLLGTLEFNSPTQPQTVNGPGNYFDNYGSATTANFTDLLLRNGSAGGVTLNLTDPSFSGTLGFIDGTIKAATGALVGSGWAISSAGQSTGWVRGKYRRSLSTTNTGAVFPIGDSLYYAGVILSIPGLISGGDVTMSSEGIDHPAIYSSPILPSQSVNRYYTLDTSDGIRFYALDASLSINWNTADQDVAIDWANFGVASFRGSSWQTETVTPITATNVSIVNLGSNIAGSYQLGMRGSTSLLTSQPADQSVCLGLNATFSTGAGAGFNYQWQVNTGTGWANATAGSLYSGVTTATLTVVAAPSSINGYQYRCKVYNTTDTVYTIAASISVNSLAGAITGASSVCAGQTTLLSCATPGGTWSNGGAVTCTINSAGSVTGTSAGTALISYTLATGCRSTKIITVNTTPAAISGATTVCAGNSTTLSSSPAGGLWISDATGVATIGATTGVVNAITAGTATVSYTLSASGCLTTTVVSVAALPAVITGASTVCTGANTTLTVTTMGGSWSSSNANSTVSSSGIVTGVSAGTSTISYTMPGGCSRTQTMTVNSSPATLTGSAAVCAGSNVTLASTTAGGSWSSSAPSTGTVSTSGIVAGLAAGTTSIIYTLPSTGCYAERIVTVNHVPDAIAGSNVCQGLSTTFTSSPTGGSWSSSSTLIATVGSASGNVNGILPGTATITYTLPTSCRATYAVTVNALPAPVSGPSSVCTGMTTTLTSTTTGGSWTSSDATIAYIGSSSGIANGVAAGTITISYLLSTGCYRTATLSVNASPSAITGTTAVCIGNNSTLAATPAGGTWSSSSTGIASVTGATGIVSAVAAGTAMISYTATNGCYATTVVTANPLPASITGTASVCQGRTTTLSNGTPGGTWSTSAATIATVGASGIVTGTGSGTATIRYTLPTGCLASVVATVNALPTTISGATGLCTGSTTTLSSSPAGGTWNSSAPAIADVASATGVVSGISFGSASITYALPTGCYVSRNIAVDTIPVFTMTGADYVCIGTPATFTTSTTGGSWQSSNASIASVNSAGVVTGNTGGSVQISYTVANSCGSFSQTKNIIVYTVAQCDSLLSATDVNIDNISMELFPNPNSGTFSLLIKTGMVEQFNIGIFNQLGQKIWEGNVRSNERLGIALSMTPGIYLLSAKGAATNNSVRFVVTNEQK